MPQAKADGFSAGLQKLQALEVHGYFNVEEENPGLLNKVLEGLTSLHLRVFDMRCSDIASPNLRCLTVIMRETLMNYRGGIGHLSGANHLHDGFVQMPCDRSLRLAT